MKKRRKRSATPFLILAFLIGSIMAFYPTFAEYWNRFNQSQAIVGYAESVAHMDVDAYAEIWENALEYNARLAESGIEWMDRTAAQRNAYYEALNVDGSGIMGYVDIPKINVSLPVYHGTEDSVLQTSTGHLEETSLPCGSRYATKAVENPLFGSHCVISGHRGLPRALLFTRLDELVQGDVFILTVLDQTLTYEVDRIRIVEPYDLSELMIEPGKDLCTLVTCTPYGVNTQRMLVRGHRVENEKKTDIRVIADCVKIPPMFVAPYIAMPVLLILIIWMLFMTSGRRRARIERERQEARRSVLGEEKKIRKSGFGR
ncbi:MAG: class C sortase [Clostridia bacterium]|nr:class C sortase [Clostridia bacterium]